MDKKKREEQKKQIEELIRHPDYRPMKRKELAVLLGVPKEKREELQQVLDELVAEGRLGLSKRGKYGIPEAVALTGVFCATAQGYGFVTVEGREEDFYIPEKYVGDALHGDRVQLVPEKSSRGHRSEGRIVRVVERNTSMVVGLYRKRKNGGVVIPDNTKLHREVWIPKGKAHSARDGQKVVVEITGYGHPVYGLEGRITEILGRPAAPGVDVVSILRAMDIPEEFPPDVLAQAEAVPDTVDAAAFPERLDLRQLRMVTIDGEDSKDLDDAVSLERAGDGYRLGVHIADVSHYVPEDSPLDREARQRGTSVYVADRVVPMLPRKLSNGICSLNQGEDRLALSCLMELDSRGCVTGHQIRETIIRVDRRMTYTAVHAVLTGDPEAERAYGELADLFRLMAELAGKLRDRRRQRGSIDFDLPETKIILDAKGNPVEIRPYPRNAATELIEDFMLAANETVAEEAYWQELPFVYRVHPEPDPEKIQELAGVLRSLGGRLRTSKGKIHPKDLQRLLAQLEDSPEEAFVSRLALRSMQQAKYSPECAGHFGLAAPYYCHFTSPIRRYPDLQIHRILKENLRGALDPERRGHYHSILTEVAALSSQRERRAVEAERAVTKKKMAQFMGSQIGEVYEGLISGVTRWGFYVELPSTVEGLVPVGRIPGDYFRLDEKQHCLVGERTGRTYRLGQPVRISVAAVDSERDTIDFALEEQV